MSSSSVSMSRLRQWWLILDLMHAGMSANIVVSAFLLLRRREEAWRDGERKNHRNQLDFSGQLVLIFDLVDSYLLLAVGIADAGHMRVRKKEVEGDGQEGQVSHEGEILAVQDDVVHSVGEGEPV